MSRLRDSIVRVGYACLVAACMPLGCTTSSTTHTRYPQLTQDATIDAPADLHDLAGGLLAYRARYRLMPESLEVLRDEQLIAASTIGPLDAYAYAPGGLARLPDGQIVLVVDTGLRIADHLWCVVREASTTPRTALLSVQLVRLTDLEAAAGR